MHQKEENKHHRIVFYLCFGLMAWSLILYYL